MAKKPATQIESADPIVVVEDESDPGYASRGGHKLAGALDAFNARETGGPMVEGRYCLDAGASTGGFTDVLLRRGAAHRAVEPEALERGFELEPAATYRRGHANWTGARASGRG